MRSSRMRLAFALAATLLPCVSARAAENVPAPTAAYIKELGIDPGLLAKLDTELKVPDAWVAGAKKEGKLRVTGSWDPDQFAKIVMPFKERYPFIDVSYTRSAFNNRSMAPLIAAREGRAIVDVMTGFGGSAEQFKEAHALLKIADLPAVKTLPSPEMIDPDGFWVAHQVTQWCITYNSNLIKQEQLPKTWDDLLADPAFSGGKLGLVNRPQLWLIGLWRANGDAWGRNYIKRLFTELKPQMRSESVNATIDLVAAGEIAASLPGSGYRTQLIASKGAPVSFYCPSPVPVSFDEIGILAASPSVNAARLFVNWDLSVEGQIAQNATDHAVPSHKDLQIDQLIPYASTIVGKPTAVSASEIRSYGAEIFKIWNGYWQTAP